MEWQTDSTHLITIRPTIEKESSLRRIPFHHSDHSIRGRSLGRPFDIAEEKARIQVDAIERPSNAILSIFILRPHIRSQDRVPLERLDILGLCSEIACDENGAMSTVDHAFDKEPVKALSPCQSVGMLEPDEREEIAAHMQEPGQ